MARVELSPLIKSMSGTISKKKLADGTTVSYVVTKKGRLYVHTTHPRTTPLLPTEVEHRAKFGKVCSAYALLQRTKSVSADSSVRKQAYAILGDIYDLMAKNRKTITPEALAKRYWAFVQ